MDSGIERHNNAAFITDVNAQYDGQDNTYSENDGPADIDSDQEDNTNKIFNVEDAVPPTDYEAPYSQLPSSVSLKRVKKKVMQQYNEIARQRAEDLKEKFKNKSQNMHKKSKSMAVAQQVSTMQQNQSIDDGNGKLPPIARNKLQLEKKKKEHWLKLLELEHTDALISDAFWYVICKLCNPKPEFEQHQEFLLDRIAANYVSFTLIEDDRFEQGAKETFFKKLYDIIAQAVFYCLYFAYPKSRKTLDEPFMRLLTNTFSELFTGTQIHSASLAHWEQTFCASHQKGRGGAATKDASIADYEISKNTKSKRERLLMRYSPLVERYLITHNYETINNVRKWNMLLTQRSQIQQDVDRKFKKFKSIAQNAQATKKRLEDDYKSYCDQLMHDLKESKDQADKHCELVKQTYQIQKENGGFNQMGNMQASLHKAQQTTVDEDKD